MDLSIIIPVYNGEAYIGECVKKCLFSKNKDYEVIIIDDGSQDRTGLICSALTENSNVKYFYQENSGVSVARNNGLKHAVGKYVMFCDSDDTVQIETVLSGLEWALENDLDIVQFSFLEKTSKKHILHQYKGNIITKSNEEHDISRNYVWAKLMKKQIIDAHLLMFDQKMKIAEDYVFILSYLMYVNKAGTISEIGYHYNNLGSGVSNKYISDLEYCNDRLIDVIEQYNLSENVRLVNRNDKTTRGTLNAYAGIREIHNLYKTECPFSRVERCKEISYIISKRFAIKSLKDCYRELSGVANKMTMVALMLPFVWMSDLLLVSYNRVKQKVRR